MVLIPFLAIFSVVSVQSDQVSYTYKNVPMVPHKLAQVVCYIRKIDKPSFSISTNSYAANGTFLHVTRLTVTEGTAIIISGWNDMNDMVTEKKIGYYAWAPETKDELPAVSVVFYANSTHFGVGSLQHIGVAAEVPFQIQDIKKMEISASGNDMLFCREGLLCQGPPPRKV